MTTFAALALYGTVKWSTLLTGRPLGRLLGLYAVAMLLVAVRPVLAARSRLLAAVATAIVLIAAFPIAGVPLDWVWHVRIAVTANAIGEGLSALPRVLVPYPGFNQWVDLVMMLGAAVLLFDAALLEAFSPGPTKTLRRAGAALPLVAMVAVPTTLVPPELPYVDGAILFGLLVAFMWGDQIGSRRAGGAMGLGLLAVVAALFVAPALNQHKPWINYRALAGGLAPTYVDGFDWTQGYGRIDWPRSGRVVLDIQAAHAAYWKAENLDLFSGVGWEQGTVPGNTPPPDPKALSRWTQKIEVTVRDMNISQVIGAGTTLSDPIGLPVSLSPGLSPGTFTTAQPLGPGDAYEESVYTPDPSAAQLNGAGANYSGLPPGYRTIELPPTRGTPSPDENYFPEETPNGDASARGYQAQLVFPPFHSGQAITSNGGDPGASASTLLRGAGAVSGHSLADVYRLAQQLSAGAATPYQFVIAIERYLGHGFTYNEKPPSSPSPLVTFLFSSHLGYCQQFAGSMALLLRMGGVPARVAVGFTSGHRDTSTNSWVVTDYDAHAWVEVWFPHYGWVTFDPTPGGLNGDPARRDQPPNVSLSGGPTNVAATGLGLSASKTVRGAAGAKGRHRGSHQAGGPLRKHRGGGSELPWIAAIVVLLLLALVLLATKPLQSTEALVAELEAALHKIGRPLPGGATLAWLERRVAESDGAVGYVRALRLARFRGVERLPTGGQRRALRRQLRLGLGPLGVVRSIWALPPRWGRPTARRAPRRSRPQTRAPRASGA